MIRFDTMLSDSPAAFPRSRGALEVLADGACAVGVAVLVISVSLGGAIMLSLVAAAS